VTKHIPSIVVTSALPYANGPIHLGHLVEYIQTDIYVRFLRLSGKSAVYCCAGDTHGAPIEINAQKLGVTPEQLVAKYLKEHQEDFAKYHITFDSYYSTNSEENRYFSEKIYASLQKNGHIYEKELELTYCEHDKRFLPDRYVKGTCPKCGAPDQYGDVCEKCNSTYTTIELIDPYCTLCGNKPVRRKSTHLFFRLSAFSSFLKEWLTKNNRLQPEIKNQILNWVKEGLDDWCISRDGPYFGFRIPGTEKYFYVWLDAPIGYISSLANYLHKDLLLTEKVWNEAEVQHFIGKDIVYFHLLFWPAVLHAAGWKLPDNVVVHGHLTVDKEKMSKSRGTLLPAAEFALLVPDTEFLRFYYAANLSHTMTDIDLSLADFTERVNKELVSNVANFVYRTLSFVEKNYDAKLGKRAHDAKAKELERQILAREKLVLDYYGGYEFRKAIQEIFHIASLGNAYLQEAAPWKEKEGGLPVLTTCANIVKDLSILLAPTLPEFARKVQEQLNLHDLSFKDLGFTTENHKIGKPTIIWTKMEPLSFEKKDEAQKAGPGAIVLPAILDLIIAKVTKVERHPQAEKLYLETIDDGSGKERIIVSGLVPYYTPEALLNKKIILVNNLKPAKLRGVLSHGMLLAAQHEGTVEVLEAHGQAGDRIVIEGFERGTKEISIDEFLQLKFLVYDHKIFCNGAPVTVHGKQLTAKVKEGKVA
jgi:methionyl-tRNA synthetase